MRIFAIISGEYGIRHVNNLHEHGPTDLTIETWRAPAVFPLIIDYPEDYLPKSFPACDLILSFAENRSVAELIPKIAMMTKARGVVAAIDNEAWLPRGLAGENGSSLCDPQAAVFFDRARLQSHAPRARDL